METLLEIDWRQQGSVTFAADGVYHLPDISVNAGSVGNASLFNVSPSGLAIELGASTGVWTNSASITAPRLTFEARAARPGQAPWGVLPFTLWWDAEVVTTSTTNSGVRFGARGSTGTDYSAVFAGTSVVHGAGGRTYGVCRDASANHVRPDADFDPEPPSDEWTIFGVRFLTAGVFESFGGYWADDTSWPTLREVYPLGNAAQSGPSASNNYLRAGTEIGVGVVAASSSSPRVLVRRTRVTLG